MTARDRRQKDPLPPSDCARNPAIDHRGENGLGPIGAGQTRGALETGDLSQIRASDIVNFLQQLVTRKPPLRDETLSSHLRNFFRYLFKIGITTVNLALGIPSVAQRFGTRLPRNLTTEQVDILVRAVRADTAGGRRNYAMVMLLARLGLRATEVIAMQLDDID